MDRFGASPSSPVYAPRSVGPALSNALLWATIVVLVSNLLTLVLIGFATWVLGLFALGVWVIYRVARGWLALNERRPIA